MKVHSILFSYNSRKYYIIYIGQNPDIRILKVGPWPHLGPSNISKGRATTLLGPCHATPLNEYSSEY